DPRPPGRIPGLARRRDAVPGQDPRAEASPAAPAEAARKAFATVESARERHARRMLADGIRARILAAAIRACRRAFPRDLPGSAAAANAALRQDRARQSISAQPGDHAHRTGAGVLLRTVPL